MSTSAYTLPGSICETNPDLVIKLKNHIRRDLRQSSENHISYFASVASTTVRYFDISNRSKDFQDFVRSKLFDDAMLSSLEEAGVLNWCRNIKPLYPLRTRGDGNCLLHAVSLAMWGMEDSCMLLRRLVYVALVEDEQKGEIKKRWHKERGLLNREISGYELTSREWEQEWEIVVQGAEDRSLANFNVNQGELQYESLEEVHIFVLANILKRPIIVIAEPVVRGMSGQSLAPNNLRGIYLPLLWKPAECTKTPIILGFNCLHFAPLLSFASQDDLAEDVCPLVTPDLESFYVHFLLRHEEGVIHRILQSYLNVTEVTYTRPDGIATVLCAKMEYKPMQERYDLLRNYMHLIDKVYKEEKKLNRQISVTKVKTVVSPTEEAEKALGQMALEESQTSMKSLGKGEKKKKPCITCLKHDGRDHYHGQCSQCFTLSSPSTQQYEVSPTCTEPSSPPKRDSLHVSLSKSYSDRTTSRQGTLTNTLVGPQIPPPVIENCSMVSQPCSHTGCRNLASVKTYPYCNEHGKSSERSHRVELKKQKSSSVSDESNPTSPCGETADRRSLEDSLFHSMGRGTPCREKGCKLYGLPEWDFRCKAHKANASHATSLLSSSWQRCRKTGCPSQGNAKYTGFCSGCYSAEDTPPVSSPPNPGCLMRITSQISLPPQNISPERSRPPSQMMVEGALCIGPECRNPGISWYKGLCDACYSCLLSKNHESSGSDLGASKMCKSSTCAMYGTKEHDGYCSKCWQDRQRSKSVIGNGARVAVMSTPLLPITPHHVENVPSATCKYCDHLAEADLNGLCSVCYRNRISRQKPSQVKVSEGSPARLPCDPKDDSSLLYQRAVQGVEASARSSSQPCRTSSCPNWGNPQANGYCNDCFKSSSKRTPSSKQGRRAVEMCDANCC